MNTSPVKCNPPLLRRSLEDGLSEQQEEWLATHLDDCVSCQQTLTTLAAGSEGWSQIEIASSDLIKVTDGEFLYTFAAVSGKWTSPNDPNFWSATETTPNIPETNTFRSRGGDRLDQEALQLARQYRGKGLNDTQALKVLNKAVTVAFDKRQEFQKSEAERMHTKLKKLQQAIESRDKLRQRIINRRVEELLDPNVNWAAASTRHKLPTPGGPMIAEPGPVVLERPVAETPIGLAGPPHTPFGTPITLKSTAAPPAARAAATWRQPTELYKELANRRRFVQMLVERIQDEQEKLKTASRSLTELRKLKEWEEMTDEDRQRGIDSVAKRIRSYQPQLTEFLGQWKQEWSLYESQLKLLQLDVEEAEIRFSAARKAADRVREMARAGVISSTEQRKAETELGVSEIAVKRAHLYMAPYAAIQTKTSELDPRNFDAKQLLKDPLEEPSVPTGGR